MRYSYSIVRFVPDPARGEFINVGAIVGSDDALEWGVRQVENLVRARHIDDHRSIGAVTGFLDDVGHQIDKFWNAQEDDGDYPAISETWLHELSNRMRNVVQLSDPCPITAEDLDDALDLVFSELIVDPTQGRLPYERRTTAKRALRRAYMSRNLQRNETFFEKVTVHAAGLRETMDFAVANGRVVQLAQAWSFQVPDQADLTKRIRAWAWTMNKLASYGGELSLEGRKPMPISGETDLEVVFIPPGGSQSDRSAFDDANRVFADIGATPVNIDEADRVSERAAKLLGDKSS